MLNIQLNNAVMKTMRIIELIAGTILLVILFYWLLDTMDHHAIARQLTVPIIFIIADIIFLSAFFMRIIKSDKRHPNG